MWAPREQPLGFVLVISRAQVPAPYSLQNPGSLNSLCISLLDLPPPSVLPEVWDGAGEPARD